MPGQSTAMNAALERHKTAFDFTVDDLGNRATVVTAAAIYAYMDEQIDPDNAPWLELSEGYDAWKQRHYPGQPISVLTGHMKQLDQLVGVVDVRETIVTQTYGTDDEARLLAEWFQEGYAPQNRPARRFYAFNDLAVASLDDFFSRHFHSIVG